MDSSIDSIIRDRRTIGAFRHDAPPDAEIEVAIESASWAPNHKKTEPWRVYWLGPESAKAVIELNSNLILLKKGETEAASKRKAWQGVPGWLVVTCTRSHDSFREEEDYAACCCFVQNMMLSLWSKEIGTKWATGDVTRDPGFFELLGIDPGQERIVGLIWYGYPAIVPNQTRQPIASFVRKLQ
jgi:nitroreductase